MNESEPRTTTDHATSAPTTTVAVSDQDELDVWVAGSGTPVLFIHGALIWNLFEPLARELAESGDYRAIWYHRRGYHGKATEGAGVPDQAQDAVEILDALGIDEAHVVSHSAGGPIALALATQAPDRVASAALLDFALPAQVPSGALLGEVLGPSVVKAHAGDFDGAADDLLSALGGSKELFEEALPGSWAGIVRDAPTWFEMDMPAINTWAPDPAAVEAAEVPLAFLSVAGLPPIEETGALLAEWQPNLTMLDITTDNHFFPITATEETAALIDGWIRGQG